MAYRWSFFFVSIVLSTNIPAELKAADGRVGATSRASIRIEASVSPRLGFRSPSTIEFLEGTGRVTPFCIWSSSPLRRYTLTLLREADGSLGGGASNDSPAITAQRISSMRLSAGKSFSAIARASIVECGKPGSDVNLALDISRETAASDGAAILILAPE